MNLLERLRALLRPAPEPIPKALGSVRCCMATSDGHCELPATRFYVLKRRHSDERDQDDDGYDLPMATCDKHFVHWEPSEDMLEQDYADRLILNGVHDA